MIVRVEWRRTFGFSLLLSALLLPSHFIPLFLSRLPKRRKTRGCRGSIVLSAVWEEVPHMAQQISLLPHPRSILFSSLRFRPSSLPARCSIRGSSRQKSASPLQGGNNVGGKVIRPLATKSFLADSCFIILHPTSTRGWLYNSWSLCLSLSSSSPALLRALAARLFLSEPFC